MESTAKDFNTVSFVYIVHTLGGKAEVPITNYELVKCVFLQIMNHVMYNNVFLGHSQISCWDATDVW